TLVIERIAAPLGMDDTRITLTEDQQERLATGHSGGSAVSNWDLPALAGAGALRSTAEDMLRFVAANLGVQESPLFAAMQMTHAPRAAAGSPDMQVGMGWHIRTNDTSEIVWHNGGTGGYRSFAGFKEAQGYGVVVFTNTDWSVDDIGFHMLDSTYALKEVTPVVSVDPDVLERYVGRYQLAPAFIITITRDGGQLTAQATGQPSFSIYPSSETEFFLKVVEAQITFNVAEDGTVESLTLHQNGQHMPGTKIE
ncbi:MAG TPA: serine hydrolase, partial [Rhodothermales bacterium]|nr:serine hydrolase [Rhodothermales bacterium]